MQGFDFRGLVFGSMSQNFLLLIVSLTSQFHETAV